MHQYNSYELLKNKSIVQYIFILWFCANKLIIRCWKLLYLIYQLKPLMYISKIVIIVLRAPIKCGLIIIMPPPKVGRVFCCRFMRRSSLRTKHITRWHNIYKHSNMQTHTHTYTQTCAHNWYLLHQRLSSGPVHPTCIFNTNKNHKPCAAYNFDAKIIYNRFAITIKLRARETECANIGPSIYSWFRAHATYINTYDME